MPRFFARAKDGGPDSNVDAYFLVEIKGLFSIALLKFNKGCREDFHSHAFHALTWFIKGNMVEETLDGTLKVYSRSLLPKLTKRLDVHRVRAHKTSWALTLRGPWSKKWFEVDAHTGVKTTLTHGRKII